VPDMPTAFLSCITATCHWLGQSTRYRTFGITGDSLAEEGRKSAEPVPALPPSPMSPPKKYELTPTPEAPPRPERIWRSSCDRLRPTARVAASTHASVNEVPAPRPI
jgi:hypothetical protein